MVNAARLSAICLAIQSSLNVGSASGLLLTKFAGSLEESQRHPAFDFKLIEGVPDLNLGMHSRPAKPIIMPESVESSSPQLHADPSISVEFTKKAFFNCREYLKETYKPGSEVQASEASRQRSEKRGQYIECMKDGEKNKVGVFGFKWNDFESNDQKATCTNYKNGDYKNGAQKRSFWDKYDNPNYELLSCFIPSKLVLLEKRILYE